MTRKRKTQGFVLVAIAVCLVVAAVASATTFAVKVGGGVKKPTITGTIEGTATFGFDIGKVICTEEADVGTSPESESEIVELQVDPNFAGCKFGGVPITLDENGCELEFVPGMIDANKNFEGSFEVICPPNKSIEFTTKNCTVTLPAQVGAPGITFTVKGTGEGRELTIDRNVTKLSYTEDPVGGTPCTKAAKTNGTLAGSVTLTAEDGAGKMIGLWVE
jgi:hypothetical protein